ncbi:MAG: type II toxin-antitoxin system VapC family toxin [Candidatus Saccharimonadales bacterium]
MLIDTHILIWLFDATNSRLGTDTDQRVKENFEKCAVSVASLAEIKIKQRRGGLAQFDIQELIKKVRAAGANILDIKPGHILTLPEINLTPHSDPFDLLIIAQAISEGLPLVTCDREILKNKAPGLRLLDGHN